MVLLSQPHRGQPPILNPVLNEDAGSAWPGMGRARRRNKSGHRYVAVTSRGYVFLLRAAGKNRCGPSRRTLAEAIADRDKILAIRDRPGGASNAEVGPPRSGGGSGEAPRRSAARFSRRSRTCPATGAPGGTSRVGLSGFRPGGRRHFTAAAVLQVLARGAGADGRRRRGHAGGSEHHTGAVARGRRSLGPVLG